MTCVFSYFFYDTHWSETAATAVNNSKGAFGILQTHYVHTCTCIWAQLLVWQMLIMITKLLVLRAMWLQANKSIARRVLKRLKAKTTSILTPPSPPAPTTTPTRPSAFPHSRPQACPVSDPVWLLFLFDTCVIKGIVHPLVSKHLRYDHVNRWRRLMAIHPLH